MDDLDLTDLGSAAPAKKGSSTWMWLFRLLVGMALAFGAGAGWQWWEARIPRQQVVELERAMELERLGGTLTAALVQAGAGRYEDARQLASDFFSALQSQAQGTPELAPALSEILSERDRVITVLSRSDPNAITVLSGVHRRYRDATGLSLESVPTPAPILEQSGDEITEVQADTTSGP